MKFALIKTDGCGIVYYIIHEISAADGIDMLNKRSPLDIKNGLIYQPIITTLDNSVKIVGYSPSSVVIDEDSTYLDSSKRDDFNKRFFNDIGADEPVQAGYYYSKDKMFDINITLPAPFVICYLERDERLIPSDRDDVTLSI